MKKVLTLTAAVILVAASCGLFHTTLLEVEIGGHYNQQVFEAEWPWGSGEFVMMNNSLTDSAGLAGIELEVVTPDAVETTLTVTDFDSYYLNAQPIEVPDEGTATIFVTLRQAGREIAQGHVSWPLQSGVDSWRIQVERAPYSQGSPPRDPPVPDTQCELPLCYRIVRLEIDENARNYSDEALWLEVDRYGRDPW